MTFKLILCFAAVLSMIAAGITLTAAKAGADNFKERIELARR